MKKQNIFSNKLIIVFTLIFAVAASCLLLPDAVLADESSYIITLKDGVDASSTFENKYDLTQLTQIDHGLYVTDAENAAILENSSLVDSVAESATRTLFVTANDPAYTDHTQWALPAINAEEGWDIATGVSGVTVVVIDTGFTYDHEDNGNVVAGKDYVDNTINTNDCATHGTATAGIIGAATNNSLGVAAACWNVHVVMLRAFYTYEIINEENTKEITTADDADIIAAIYDAVDVYDADVISMSFGGSTTYNAYEDAYEYAYEQGVILVAAAGNSGKSTSPLEYPAAYDEVIGVGAVDSGLNRADYSSANEAVYIAAPGSDIYCMTNPAYGSDKKPLGDLYGYFNGTSMATPYVAALAALCRSVDPDITQEEFKYYLRSNSEDLAATGYDVYTGYGLIDYSTTLAAIEADLSNTQPSGQGTTSDPYLISNESELDWFKTAVDSGSHTLCARLTANITITDSSWYPIESYQGTFDGNGYILDMGTNGNSFFSSVETSGTVKNLTVTGTINSSNHAALITTENYGMVKNCTASGSVSAKYSGGICSFNYGTITRCVNRATVSGSSYSGGITAVSTGGTVSYCYNTGAISSATNYAAGICSFAEEGTTLSSCYNTAALGGTITTRGIVAKNSDSTVNNCFYDKNIITNGTSSTSICGKTTATMQTKGFVCLINHGNGSFALDSKNTNNGYPLLTGSYLTTYFNDVAINAWYTDYVYDLAAENIIIGKDNHLYAPYDTVTRAEYTAILARTSEEDLSAYAGQASFSDVETDQWYAASIAWAYDNGIVKGIGNHLFAPNNQITREEIAAITIRFVEYMKSNDLSAVTKTTFTDDDTISDWAKESVAIMAEQKILTGFPDGSFAPKEQATRAQAATIMDKVLNVYLRY